MRAVDLFCGCGGLSLGLQNAGIAVVLGVDSWGAALDMYSQNFHHEAEQLDLSNVDIAAARIKALNVDLIAGGPPCQDFSSAGKRNENDGRGDLTVSYAAIVASVRPRMLIIENIPRITKSRKQAEAKEIYKAEGYGLTGVTLDASLCGAPQRRKRYFLIGSLNTPDDFLTHTLIDGQSARAMTVRDHFGERLGTEFYYRHPRSYARRGIFSVDEPSPTIRGENRPIPSGYKLHAGDPVQTLEGVRPLTAEERAEIQTYPPSFRFSGSRSEVEQMVGHAMPVKLAEYVGRHVKAEFEQDSIPTRH